MEYSEETSRWMKDATDCYQRARRCFSDGDWRGTVQNAQLAIELSVKAVIAFIEEPHWTHNPDEQLKKIIEEREGEIREKFGQEMVDGLLLASEDVRIAAPWHGWSVYGRPREDGTGWTSAVDLCREENARDLMGRTERTIATVQMFLSGL